jgi:branched-chain amino acid transport system ATP-binding protein
VSAADPLLRAERLTKAFGSLVVTRNVDLTVARGERHVVIGPNGAGKTSLIHQLAGQLRPTSGRIFLKGVDVTYANPEQISRRGLARTFQRNNLFPNLTVIENVRLAVQARRGRPLDPFSRASADRALMARAEAVLATVRISSGFERPVRMLSYGEQRQLEIALALAGEPDILLLDEPTSGMSPAETERMIGLIRELPRELGLLMIEHDMTVVFSVADRITVLHYGEVLASGPPAEISADPRVREVYLGAEQGH